MYLSTDGGQTYTSTMNTIDNNLGRTKELKPDPTNPMVYYATTDNGSIIKSTDGGGSWTEMNQKFATGRVAIAVAESNSDVLYVSATDGTNFHSLWKSNDAGATWNQTGLAASAGDYIGNQGWFNNQISVNPFNENELYIGGLQLWKSTDAGETFTRKTSWTLKDYGADYDSEAGSATNYAHADFHGMISYITDKDNQKFDFYLTTDGGIFKSSDGCETLSEINNNLYVTQFYSVAHNGASGSGMFVGGTQDNGDIITNNSTDWVHSRGGDGGFTEINSTDSTEVFTEYVYLDIRRSTQSGTWGTYSSATNGIPNTGSSSSNALNLHLILLIYRLSHHSKQPKHSYYLVGRW